MATKTLQNILNDIGAYIDQDTSLPTGTELSVRVNLVDQSLQEWAQAYDWDALRVKAVITVASTASFALPANFKKMEAVYDNQFDPPITLQEVPLNQLANRNSLDQYFTISGNDSIGKSISLNLPNAGVSLVYYYRSFPSSMVTLADTCVCPLPEFIVRRTLGHILESRSDTRFPSVKAEAQLLLDRMIEEEDTPSGSENNTIPSWTTSSNFVLGE